MAKFIELKSKFSSMHSFYKIYMASSNGRGFNFLASLRTTKELGCRHERYGVKLYTVQEFMEDTTAQFVPFPLALVMMFIFSETFLENPLVPYSFPVFTNSILRKPTYATFAYAQTKRKKQGKIPNHPNDFRDLLNI